MAGININDKYESSDNNNISSEIYAFLPDNEISLPETILPQANPDQNNLLFHTEFAKKIPDFDYTYTLQVNNPAAFSSPVALWGADQFLFGGFGIVVLGVEATYNEMLQESITKPFIVGGMIISTTNTTQFNNLLRVQYRNSNGVICSRFMHPNSYFSVDQFQNGFVEVYPIDLTITAETSIQFTILPLTNMTFTFFVKKRLNKANTLHDEPIIEKSDEQNIAQLFTAQQISLRV